MRSKKKSEQKINERKTIQCTFSRRVWISSWSFWVGSWMRSFCALTCNVNSSIRFSLFRISFWCNDSSCSFACRSSLIWSRNSEKRLIYESCCCWRRFWSNSYVIDQKQISDAILWRCLSRVRLLRRHFSVDWIYSFEYEVIFVVELFSKKQRENGLIVRLD